MKKDWNARLEEITQTDKAIWATGRAFAGIDEAGRGPLCGPVAAACVVMPPEPLLLYVDAITRLDVPGEVRGLVHGDALCYSIAAASILAKVTRDRIMRELDARYPQYGLAKNKGYGTAEHIAALRQYGPTPIHRRSFIGHFVEV